MALTNAQYESIFKGYARKQDSNRHIVNERKAYVYEHVDGYREADDKTSSLSVQCAKRLLSGDDNALADLHLALEQLSSHKSSLLLAAGLPADYLEPVYDCPDCKDTGYVEGQRCHCLKQQMISLLYEQSNIRETIASENFSTLSYEYYEGMDLEHFQNAVRTCTQFVESISKEYRNLFFYGTVGTGKSFLSGCIAKELLEQGHSVIYFSAIGLFEMLARYSFDIKSKETLYNVYEDLYNCDLVIIDDLGTELTNSFVTSQLFSCLNERHLGRKPTIISTNLSLEEMRDRYSDRIFSRITSNYQVCKLSGPDIRMYKKRMANRK